MDLNADLGEGAGSDPDLLRIVTSANIACGAHAGSISVMRETATLARELGVAIGAHPGYPDPVNFGRVEIGATAVQIQRWVGEQVATLREICATLGADLRYVKAHGALYNRAVHDREAAAAIASAVHDADAGLVLLAPAGSRMLAAAETAGLRTAREAFLDRAYNSDGTLVPRNEPGAVLTDPDTAAERALAIARGEVIRDATGKPVHIPADSLCVHGDSTDAVALARTARARLVAAGVVLAPFA